MPDGADATAATRRFYGEAGIRPEEGGFGLVLDGRPARTPGRRPLTLPTEALGQAVAAEWAGQGPTIDPRTMPLTRLANSAIDGVAREVAAVQADIVRYAGSDLVAYRAGEPEPLVAMQATAWDPVLDWAREALGARFVLSQGVMFVEQPPAALDRVRAAVEADSSPFRLAALHVLTTLTGSVLIALMHASGALDADAAWAAAHVDETFQESRWGTDGEAALRRAAREAEFRAASRFSKLAR
ncbi:MAG: ATPase [Methylobacteriaceae bacterium]|nr:ATPase [Methylobacteriaceae bacterium]